jgi:hypothetical protein
MTQAVPKDDLTTASKLTDKGRYWLNHLQQCQASGQSMAAYARTQGLGLKSFYRWRHQLRFLPAEEITDTSPLFHPVQITGSGPTGTSVKTLSMVLRLPNGIDCELKQVTIETLTEALLAVAKLP